MKNNKFKEGNMLGTIVNSLAIVVGAFIGLFLKGSINKKS